MAYALFLLYLVVSYIHPAEIIPELAPYRVTFWIGITALAGAIASLLGGSGRLVPSLQLWAVTLLTIVMAASLVVAERWLGAPIAVIQRFGPSLTVFLLAITTVTSFVRLGIAAGCVIALTLALVMQGTVAYHFGFQAQLFLMNRSMPAEDLPEAAIEDQESASIEYTADDLANERRKSPRIQALGFMRDPNDLAVVLIVGLGLVAGAWKPRGRDLLRATAAAALVYGIYLTGSRGGMVALVFVLWRIAAPRFGSIPALVLLLALGTGAMALDFSGRSLSTELDASASERLVAWREGLEMLKLQPLLGVGYGQFLDHHTLTAHNSLVLCVAETGLLGGFLWTGLLVVTLLELRGLKNLGGDHPFDRTAREWATGLQLSLFGFIAAAFFLSRTFVPTLYLIVGLSTALAAIARRAGRPVPLPRLPDLGMLVLVCEALGIGVVYTMVKLYAA